MQTSARPNLATSTYVHKTPSQHQRKPTGNCPPRCTLQLDTSTRSAYHVPGIPGTTGTWYIIPVLCTHQAPTIDFGFRNEHSRARNAVSLKLRALKEQVPVVWSNGTSEGQQLHRNTHGVAANVSFTNMILQ